jgi:hypothetical protein
MVQDMFDPEFFLGTCAVQKMTAGGPSRLCTAMYRDVINCAPDESVDFESLQNVTNDRQTVYCIPVPAENAWVKEVYASMAQAKLEQSAGASRPRLTNKRSVDCDEAEESWPTNGCSSMPDSGTVCADAGNGLMDTGDATDNGADGKTVTPQSFTKRTKTVEDIPASVTAPPLPSLPELNFPLPTETGLACLVKLYDTSVDLKLNDVIEVFGILSTDPSMAVFHDHSFSPVMGDGLEASIAANQMMDDGMQTEHLAKNPPPSLVPRLHAVIIRKLDHSNPCLPASITTGCSVADGTSLHDVGQLREEILAVLEHALVGDRLAAEYLLCHLVSSVYSRQNVIALGKFSLNLSGCPRDRNLNFIGHLSRVLSLLITKSYLLPMSLANMNELRFVPRKDYSTNRLRSGLLQLSAHTQLIIDETALEPGQLDANGVANITALGDVVSWQKLDYDFEFHRQPFPTNINVLVMSEGKSILKCDCQVPLLHDMQALSTLDETYRGIDTYLTPHLLRRIRAYLGQVQLLAYSLTDDVQKIIEEDFVASRRDSTNNMTIDDFHSLLTLARLLSLTNAEPNLTVTTWHRAKSLESLRKQRLQVM